MISFVKLFFVTLVAMTCVMGRVRRHTPRKCKGEVAEECCCAGFFWYKKRGGNITSVCCPCVPCGWDAEAGHKGENCGICLPSGCYLEFDQDDHLKKACCCGIPCVGYACCGGKDEVQECEHCNPTLDAQGTQVTYAVQEGHHQGAPQQERKTD